MPWLLESVGACTDLMKEGETGTGFFDPLPYGKNGKYNVDREVARIYMEFVPGGDCHQYYQNLVKDSPYVIPEEHVWSILHCLAKACLVLGKSSFPLSGGLGIVSTFKHKDSCESLLQTFSTSVE